MINVPATDAIKSDVSLHRARNYLFLSVPPVLYHIKGLCIFCDIGDSCQTESTVSPPLEATGLNRRFIDTEISEEFYICP
jgi:hypothetical protein